MVNSPKVTVKAGETAAGIDRAMDRLAIARGRVVDAGTGAPIAGVKVSGKGYYSASFPVYTDNEGRYELPGLDEGEYALTIRDRSHAYVDGESEKVLFSLGAIVDMPDVKLKQWGEFAGTVTDKLTGQPVAGVWVQLYAQRSSGDWHVAGGCYAITEPDGTYRIKEVYDVTVRPVFYDPQARFHAQSYGGGKSLLDAQAVTFKREADLLGVDAALARRMDTQPVPIRLYLPVIVAE
jgi:5-hydroxyisourate hydrolase-like protein (transthyretin family)